VSSNVIQSGPVDVKGKKNENVDTNDGNVGIESENTCSSGGFQRAFSSFFGAAVEHFSPIMFFNLDKLEKQLNNTEFDKVNESLMQTQEGMVNMVKDNCDVSFVVTESNGTELEKQDESSRSSNDTRAEGAVIRLSNDTKLVNEVQSTSSYNMFANDKQHAKQPKFINEGKVDQDAEQRLDKPLFLASIIKNKITKSVNQTLESENDCLKKTIAHSKVKTIQCDEVKVKVNFDEIETKNIKLEHQVASLLKENEHLKLVYKNLFDSIKKSQGQTQKENLRTTLSEFAIDHILGKADSSLSLIAERHISELEKESGENIYENENCDLQTKIFELGKVLTQQTKDLMMSSLNCQTE
ncbi:hypothetical protein Tco_1170392, partial [Tanacetum coccineum]